MQAVQRLDTRQNYWLGCMLADASFFFVIMLPPFLGQSRVKCPPSDIKLASPAGKAQRFDGKARPKGAAYQNVR
jgi:hypothetical protein